MSQDKTFPVDLGERLGSITATERVDQHSDHLMILAHGAGAGMNHSFMEGLSKALLKYKIATWRFNFPYMEKGGGRPDRKAVCIRTIAELASHAQEQIDLPLLLAGKSFGGRMMSHYLVEHLDQKERAVLFYGFPLHPGGKPSTARADHLPNVKVPMLFIQGDRDRLAQVDLMKDTVATLERGQLDLLPGADHSFRFLKKYQIGDQEMLELLAKKSRKFIETI